MRKPRDYDAELKALEQKAKALKTRKQSQLGELVMATGADALPIEELAGALLAAADAEAVTREAWYKRGAAFFRRDGDATARSGARAKSGGAAADNGAKASAPTATGPA